jgi:hypothetical protein
MIITITVIVNGEFLYVVTVSKMIITYVPIVVVIHWYFIQERP